ncbi:MAG TPA: hypothetical protein VFL91_27180 [Thermomicrobiales bacterium]|nr:hypothetical protein [Thermomicrobiales bacterium]
MAKGEDPQELPAETRRAVALGVLMRALDDQSRALIAMREDVVLRSGGLYAERVTLAEARELRRLAKEAEAAALALKRALASLKYNLGD